MAGPALTDVPDRYDVVFSLNDGTTYGFMFADSVESNLPFRTHKAVYSYSPTFLERENVSNQYGDNFQDFFLTGSQDDFSLGESQKFFRVNDQDRSRRYYAGLNVEPTSVPGNVTLTRALVTGALTSTAFSVAYYSPRTFVYADATNLYAIDNTFTNGGSLGAHGLGASPQSMVQDSALDPPNLYICNDSVSLIRKFNNSTWSSFSSTACSQIVYLNNALYGVNGPTGTLYSFDSSGNATAQFNWKNPDGTAVNVANADLNVLAYGGSIYISLFIKGQGWQLWVYDGAGCRELASLPPDFRVNDMCVSQGIVYFTGRRYETSSTTTARSQVYFYVNGSIGKLWESPATASFPGSAKPVIGGFNNGVVFNDFVSGSIFQYDLGLGGVHTIAQESFTAGPYLALSPISSIFLLLGATSGGSVNTLYGYPGTSYNSSGYVQTSQYDFDNTLTKIFRGIKIDADIPANTSVDLAYQLDGAGGTYTSLKTGASSGVEYTLPANTSGHSISVQVTLNSTNGSATPTLKRVYVRAAPTLQQFRKREFLLDLSGGRRDELGKASMRNRDNTVYPMDPDTAATALEKIATQTVPFTVADRRTGSVGMTCLPDLQQNSSGYEGFAIYDVRPNVLIGRINLREV